MMGARITVYENTAPKLTLQLRKRVPGGGYAPYLLDGGPTIEFIGKVSPNDADGSAVFNKTGGAVVITADGTATNALYSVVTVQLAAVDIATPRNLYWFLRVTKSGLPDVVDDGILEVRNV
jgi:hypothetical protein